MSASEIKDHLHEIIDKIDDVHLLNEIDGLINDVLLIDEGSLKSETRQELNDAIEEGLKNVSDGKVITYDEFRKTHAKWFSK